MFNVLLNTAPDNYKGYSINTSFKTALKVQHILEDPQYNNGSQIQRMAAFLAAFSLLYKDEDIISQDKLGFSGAIEGLFWWLSCGNDDKVENYWRNTGIMPDIESNEFDLDDYNSTASDNITIDYTLGNGTVEEREVSKTAILCFKAPDGTIRYKKEVRGEPETVSLYEDSSLIYSGFYRLYGLDLFREDIHWFTFCMLLAELESTEGTALSNKEKIRSFKPEDYKGSAYADYRKRMEQNKAKARLLGIMPYKLEGDK